MISLLYIGTFGSFIGFSFAFGQVLQVQFTADFGSPVKAAYLTFLGPLLGSLIRPVGGALADRFGGARVTFWNFVAMAREHGAWCWPPRSKSRCALFLVGFIALFVVERHRQRLHLQDDPGDLAGTSPGCSSSVAWTRPPPRGEARRRSGALIGLAGAIGAFGGVLVNLAFRQSFLSTGAGNSAYVSFLGFYALCFALTWVVYLRREPVPGRAGRRVAAAPDTATAPAGG